MLNAIREVYLECVTEKHNKFYRMTRYDNGTWLATWGRIGAMNPQSMEYPNEKWAKKYNEKLNKGYELIDDTDLTQKFDQEKYDRVLEKLEKVEELLISIDAEESETVSRMVRGYSKDPESLEREHMAYLNELYREYK